MPNRKIAIMTWYTYRNFGTVLQASALYKKIKELGYSPDLIQYKPKGNVIEPNLPFLLRGISRKIKGILSGTGVSLKQNELFAEYLVKQTSETDLCCTDPELNELNDRYDAFVCGSDQIWSPSCYDEKYFLSFVEKSEQMVAYAPSMGVTEIRNPMIRENCAKHISRFGHLSVREHQSAELIRELTGQEAEVVLDPTLLLQAEQWDDVIDVAHTPRISDDAYMICYFLGDSTKYMGYVRKLASHLNINFYLIPISKLQRNQKNAVPFAVGPNEFVSLIRNARYICTDSFHGTAFAVNYNIPFTVFKRFKDDDPQSQNSRIIHLLDILELQDRMADYRDKAFSNYQLTCDFSNANARLENQRARSNAFLEKALSKAVHKNINQASHLSESS